MEGTHDAAVFDGPVGADEGEKVGEVGDSETEITLKDRGLAYLEMESMNVEIEIWLTFRTDLPFICELYAVLADDGEARTIRNIEAGCADDGVAFSFDAVAAYDAFLGDGLHGGEVDVDVFFLNRPVECQQLAYQIYRGVGLTSYRDLLESLWYFTSAHIPTPTHSILPLLHPIPNFGVNPSNNLSSFKKLAILAFNAFCPSTCPVELLKNAPQSPLT